jgi:hypothetical protein
MKDSDMRKILARILIFSLLLLLGSCSSRVLSESSPYGSYHYRSYNFLGSLVGEGTIYINKSDSNMVTGNWSIREIVNCSNCGKQFGNGYLEGYIENDTMVVNLNPDDTEIDTKLIGVFLDNEFSGDWRWTNLQGFGFSGKFTAFRL